MGILEFLGLRRLDDEPDQELPVRLDAADLQRLRAARRTLEQAAVTDDDTRALALLAQALLGLQGVARQDHQQVAELRREIADERADRLADQDGQGGQGGQPVAPVLGDAGGADGGGGGGGGGDPGDSDDESGSGHDDDSGSGSGSGSDEDSSSSSSSEEEEWDHCWDIVVEAENELGWDTVRRPVAGLKDPLWIQTGSGADDFQAAYQANLDLKSPSPWLLEGSPYVWAIAESAGAIQIRIAHPTPKKVADLDSDKEPEGFVAMETEELHPERKGEGELVNYAGDKLPKGLDLPTPYEEKGDGTSVAHAYKRVSGTLYGDGPMQPGDVVQGLGNCYFMGSLASLTTTPAGRKLLKQRVDDVQGIEPVGDGKVTAYLPVMSRKDGGEMLVCAGRGASADAPPPLWPALLEQQQARRQGGYQKVDGGTAASAFEQLGVESETLEVLHMPAAKLKAWFLTRSEYPFVVGTPPGYSSQPSGGPAERVPHRALGFLYCEDSQSFPPKQLKVQAGPDGAVDFDGLTITYLLDADGQPPGDDPEWVSAPVKYVSAEVASRYHLSCKPKFKNPRRLTPQHLYSVSGVDNQGIELWDQQKKVKVSLSYADVSESIRTVTVALVK